MTNSPTLTIYGQLQEAYTYFNRTLFDNELPNCIITLHRHARAYGYFISGKYKAKGSDARADEIALNPDHLMQRSDRQSLSTLVHEMVHLWEAHHGKPGRNGYHSKGWATKMHNVGLTPTATGLPGGAETGQKVTHIIRTGGPFDTACAALLALPFELSWGSLAAPPKETKQGKRTKYVCPDCEAAVWGKPDLNLLCSDCDAAFEPQD